MDLTREEALENLREHEPTENTVHGIISELASYEGDIYNSDLLEWIAAEYRHHHFVEREIEDMGFDGVGGTFMGAIRAGQVRYAEHLYWEAWEEVQREQEEEDFDDSC